MKVDIEEISSTKRALRIELPPQSLLEKLEVVYLHLAKKARLPGFRPGKIPRDVLRSRFKEEAKREALQELVPESYSQALKEANLNPVCEPSLDEVVCEEGEPFSYRATFDVKPELQLSGYTGVEVHKEKVEATDAEVDRALEYLRDRAAEYVPMDGWPALQEDLLVVDYEGFAGGKPLKGVSGQNASILLGAHQFLPEFEAQLHGLKKGETKEFSLEFPNDYGRRELAGKRVLFRVTVKEVKKKQVPPLDNDFARSASACEDVSELREKVRQDLLAHKELEHVGRLKSQILEKLRAAHPFDSPESLVDAEVEAILADLRRDGGGHRATPIRSEDEATRTRAKDLALKRVRNSLLLEAVAKQEALAVSEEELQSEIELTAAALNQKPEAFRKLLEREGRIETIRMQVLERKALDLLYERAKVVEGVNLVTLA
ncbi:trigger factor [Candidatus Methylomirabilis limnetica]|uniref:Trigger factor n=1 Tax=Candidatus Methylomirabilis limnetica TaxID=2033718 RepID=A0A2T4TV69_9BACT|nr:trigger factor [Candidatus Methylomirabilis limnetica]PTL35010.1 trigger factor [Candidatus Methylomirabilis limnetica]